MNHVMTQEVARRFSARWPWVVAVPLVIATNVVLVGMQSGGCIDYSAEPGAESTCSSGPILGIAGTWVLGIVSVFAVAYCLRRIVRPGGRR
jgi:hypothetical protein